MTNQVIPDAAVEVAAKAEFDNEFSGTPAKWEFMLDDTRHRYQERARAVLGAAAPHIAAQALTDAVDAFPLETISAPDNAVAWLMRRAEEIRPTP